MFRHFAVSVAVLVCMGGAGASASSAFVNASSYTTLQAAHDALPDSGGELFVPCGTYAQLAITKNNVTVNGAGDCAVVQSRSKQENAITITAGLSDVTIQNLSVRGAWTGGVDQWDEAHIYVGNAIYAAGTRDLPITNLLIQNNLISTGNNGVLLHRVTGGSITGNRFVNTTVASLAQAAVLTSTNVTVSKNTFTDSAKTANAIYLRGDGDAFGGNGADTGVTYSTVSDNVATGNYSYEVINVLCGNHLTIARNQLTVRNGVEHSTGIQLQQTAAGPQPDTQSQTHHNLVTGNLIDISVAHPGGGNNGITVSDQSGAGHGFGANDNHVTNNVIRMAGRGIAAGWNCARNIINGNDVTITTSAGGFDGIGVTDSSARDTEVSGNTVRRATGHGINDAGRNTRITNNLVVDGSNRGGSGVYVSSSAGATLISGNTFRNNAGRAITISGALASVEVRDNVENGNGLPDSFAGVTLSLVSVAPSLSIKPGDKAYIQLIAAGHGKSFSTARRAARLDPIAALRFEI